MRLYPIPALVLAIALSLALAGCGGGGGGNPATIPNTPTDPGTNQAPSITSVSPQSPVSISSSSQRMVTCAATDPDGDPLTYQWSTDSGTITPLPGENYRATFTAPAGDGVCTVLIRVSDDHSHTTEAIVVFDVGDSSPPENQPPVINSVTANPTSVALGATSALSVDASDPDDSDLTYVWITNSGAIEASSEDDATWRAPMTAGNYTINVSVSDGNNPAVLGTVQVTVGGGSGGEVRNGLRAEYKRTDEDRAYPDLSQSPTVLTREDPNINFDWERQAPCEELVSDPLTGNTHHFGVRWTGHILSDAAGTYFFKLRYDDGALLRIWDGTHWVSVIDGWRTGPFVAEGSISLGANTLYPIQVDYFEAFVNAHVQLMWTPPGGAEQVVPSNKLRVD